MELSAPFSPPPRNKIVICFVITDDIHSNIESSSAATTQGRVQLTKASKSSKAKSSWVSSLNIDTLLSSSSKDPKATPLRALVLCISSCLVVVV